MQQMTKPKKPTHGGKRPGAGAKPRDEHARKKVSLYLRVDLIEGIDAREESRNASVEAALLAYLARENT